MVDIATGWTECLPLLTRDGSLVVEAMKHAQSLFPWLLRGVDFDNDSAFMNDVVVPWCREQKLEVTRSRAYKKNDQAFVEQKNGAVVRRLMGYGRFDGVETARVMGRLYAAARLYVNFFQPSFKLKEKRREGAKVIKRYHPPATPYERALAHLKFARAIKRGLATAADKASPADPLAFARSLGTTATTTEVRATHRRPKRRYKKRIRMPSKLDPYLATIENWLAVEPPITALTIVRRLAAIDPSTFGDKQHSIVQRLLRSFRQKRAETIIASMSAQPITAPGMRGAACDDHSAPPTVPPIQRSLTKPRTRRPSALYPSSESNILR
jgi:hypothetical protein